MKIISSFRRFVTVCLFFLSGLFSFVNAEPAVFTLTNNTDVVIIRLDVETVRGDEWWTLEEGRFLPGQSVEITINDGRADCNYHFRVYYEDDGIKYRDYYDVNVCNNPHWTLP